LRQTLRGGASKAGSFFQVKNADPSGVVLGGLMKFESTLIANELNPQLMKTGVMQPGAQAQPIVMPITMRVDSVEHSADARVSSPRWEVRNSIAAFATPSVLLGFFDKIGRPVGALARGGEVRNFAVWRGRTGRG
jgi:hypothetical protein